MGTWSDRLLDDDRALDLIGTISDRIETEIDDLRRAEASEEVAARCSGLVGLLLQVSPDSFSGDFGATVAHAISHLQAWLDPLPKDAEALLRRIAAGDGPALAERKGGRSGALRKTLGDYIDHRREPALFAHPASSRVVQEMAEQCASIIDDDLLDESVDLYGLDCMGALGVLLIIEPCYVQPERITRWRDTL